MPAIDLRRVIRRFLTGLPRLLISLIWTYCSVDYFVRWGCRVAPFRSRWRSVIWRCGGRPLRKIPRDNDFDREAEREMVPGGLKEFLLLDKIFTIAYL